jgi:hypothetical protein
VSRSRFIVPETINYRSYCSLASEHEEQAQDCGGGRVSKEQLAHKVLLDPGFTDEGNCAENPRLCRIRASFHRAFWDSLADELLLAPPCYANARLLLAGVEAAFHFGVQRTGSGGRGGGGCRGRRSGGDDRGLSDCDCCEWRGHSHKSRGGGGDYNGQGGSGDSDCDWGDGGDNHGHGGGGGGDHLQGGDGGSRGICCICQDALGAIAPHCRACNQAMGHPECVLLWLDSYSNTCPLCRTLDPLLVLGAQGRAGDGPSVQAGASDCCGAEVQRGRASCDTLAASPLLRIAMVSAGNGLADD